LHIGDKLTHLIKSVEHGNRTLGLMVDDLLDDMKKVTLLPFFTLFGILPRMVRDISRDLGKTIDLQLTGGEIEIDKRILEGINDPLIHLIRNSVDHGIENPEERKALNKHETGTISLAVSQTESNKVEINLTDDGKGIDIEEVKTKAVKSGLISEVDKHKISDHDALSLIFQSGVSTSSIITEISGRGLGMAVVQENIANLGGTLTVENTPGKGASFKLQLPVTMATFRGILVTAAGHFFILPNSHVEHIVEFKSDSIKTVENKTMIAIDDQAVSLINLSDVLGLPQLMDPKTNETENDRSSLQALIMGSGEKKIAFVVDEILNEQEVLVKNLGKQLARVTNISGATILGSGRVVPIINTNDLIRTSTQKTFLTKKQSPDEDKKKAGNQDHRNI